LDLEEIRRKIAEINMQANRIRVLYEKATPIIEQISTLESQEEQDNETLDVLYANLKKIIKDGKALDVEQGDILMLGPKIKRLSVL
tara:strand:+ start:432 stop:689 length:258 start_codon:yes stop_codon:yes gene_type:complete